MSKNQKFQGDWKDKLAELRGKLKKQGSVLSAEERLLLAIFNGGNGNGYRKVVIPANVSVDSTFSVWLAEHFGLITHLTEIDIISAFNPEKRQPGVLYLNVGGGELDHHGRGKVCTADLLFQFVGKRKDKVLADFVDYVRMQDLSGRNEIRNGNLRIFLPPVIIRGLKMAGFSAEEIVGFMDEWWSGLFMAERVYRQKEKFSYVKWVTVKSDNVEFTSPLTLAISLAIFLLKKVGECKVVEIVEQESLNFNENEIRSDKGILRLVWELASESIIDENERKVWKRIVDRVCSNLSFSSDDLQDRILHPENAVRGMLFQRTVNEVVDIMNDFWVAIFKTQFDFWVIAAEEVKNSLKLYEKKVQSLNRMVTVAVVTSTSPSAIPALNYHLKNMERKADVIVVDRGKSGLQIHSHTLDLRQVAAYLRMEECVQKQRRLRVKFSDLFASGMIENVPEWFLIDPEPGTDKCRLLLSRSQAAPDMPMTKISLEKIVELIFVALNGWRPRDFCHKRGQSLDAVGAVCVGPALCPFFFFDIPACARPKERARELGLSKKNKK